MFLGLDLGTTNVKVLLVEKTGGVVSSGSAPVRIDHLPDGGVEQDMDDIFSAALAAIGAAAKSCDLSRVEAVGVSSQGGAMQLLSDSGACVGPVISWLDKRGKPFNDAITSELGAGWFIEHTGHSCSELTIGQLLRLKAQGDLPQSFRVGFAGDVIVSRMCGRAAHDATSLSLGMFYNPSLNDADPELLKRLGLSLDQLPDLVGANVSAGSLSDRFAAATSLPVGIPVSPAIHDQYASALACGAVHAGDIMVGAGTAWVLLAVADRLVSPAKEEAFICRHPVEGLYGQILSLPNAGAALAWAISTVQLADDDEIRIDEVISTIPPGSDGLRCRQIFSADAKAAPAADTAQRLRGLESMHTPGHIVRAVIEGIAFELDRHIQFLVRAGAGVKRLLICGRAAESEVTARIISDICQLPVDSIAVTDTSALGAAIIGRSLTEPSTDLAEISMAMVPEFTTTTPGPDTKTYAGLFQEYEGGLS